MFIIVSNAERLRGLEATDWFHKVNCLSNVTSILFIILNPSIIKRIKLIEH